MKISFSFFLFFSLSFILSMMQIVYAASIGSMSQTIQVSLLKGDEITQYLTLFNPDDIEATIGLRSNLEWILFTEEKIKIPSHGSKKIAFKIQVPLETPNDNYSALILAEKEDDGGKISLSPTIGIPVSINVGGDETANLVFLNAVISDGEVTSPVLFHLFLKNAGNVLLEPRIDITIQDQDEIVDEIHTKKIIRAGDEKEEKISWTPLRIGEYNATIIVSFLNNTQKKGVSFVVLEKGFFARSGSLESIFVNASTLQKPAKINALFVNNGSLPVEAKFVAEVRKGDSVVKVLESDPLIIDANEESKLYSYFTPEESAEYTITGHIVYSGKETEEKTAFFSIANENTFLTSSYLENASLFLLGVCSVCLVLFTIKCIQKRKIENIEKKM